MWAFSTQGAEQHAFPLLTPGGRTRQTWHCANMAPHRHRMRIPRRHPLSDAAWCSWPLPKGVGVKWMSHWLGSPRTSCLLRFNWSTPGFGWSVGLNPRHRPPYFWERSCLHRSSPSCGSSRSWREWWPGWTQSDCSTWCACSPWTSLSQIGRWWSSRSLCQWH